MSGETRTRLSKEEEAAFKEAVEKRILSGIDFTYMGLCIDTFGSTHDIGRLVDKAIQRLRRAGKVAYRREKGNRSPIWKATATHHPIHNSTEK